MGPWPGHPLETEQFRERERPSRWYLTGFLVPTDAPDTQRHDPEAEEQIDTAVASEDGTGDDDVEPDRAPARKAVLPSSLGVSVLVPKEATSLEAEVVWGDYKLVAAPESIAAPVESEVDLGVSVANLALDTRWLPAVENRGEGVFLALDTSAVRQWMARPAVKQRAKEFLPGIQSLLRNKAPSLDVVEQVYMPYVMLHSLSHLLLTAIALECGYAAASIRERIYVREEGYGILLYTATPDAEGTLGGLVQVGRKIGRHLEAALELGRLCSNDPVCAQHKPDRAHEDRKTHGAACHGCVLIAEPSCERRNDLLDRSLVVPTVDIADMAFFSGEA